MSAARASTPLTLKLLPALATAAPAQAARFGLPLSTFIAALVWNDTARPQRGLAALPREGKLVRQPLPCSLRPLHRRLARRRAREQCLSLNAYLEALLSAALARTVGEFAIYPRKP